MLCRLRACVLICTSVFSGVMIWNHVLQGHRGRASGGTDRVAKPLQAQSCRSVKAMLCNLQVLRRAAVWRLWQAGSTSRICA